MPAKPRIARRYAATVASTMLRHFVVESCSSSRVSADRIMVRRDADALALVLGVDGRQDA
jgi:hypothetical protein